MKLEKKTIYRVKSKEKFNAMMKDAKEQGFYWNEKGDAELHPDYWDVYCEDTNVRIDTQGYMLYGRTSTYEGSRLDHARKEYEITPEIYPINFGCVGIDAPDFKTAYEAFRKHMLNIFGDKSETNTYTVRVDDNQTTVITPDGKVATAKCHPDDEFDIIEGFKTAIEKIREMDRKLTDDEKTVLNALKTLGIETFYISENEVNGITDYEDILATIIIEEDDFKWCEEYENYSVAELLEKYA